MQAKPGQVDWYMGDSVGEVGHGPASVKPEFGISAEKLIHWPMLFVVQTIWLVIATRSVPMAITHEGACLETFPDVLFRS